MSPVSDNKNDLPDAMLEDAAIWLARLKDSHQDNAEQIALVNAFTAWLAADPRHHQAYQEMENLWGRLDAPISQFIAEQHAHNVTPLRRKSNTVTRQVKAKPSRIPQKHARFAIAASLVMALLTGVGNQQDWLSQWQSDYTTTVGEELPITTDDGSLITLNTDSALTMNYSANERRVRLLKGEAWFAVSPDDHRPFTVETEKGTVRVTGTQFNVRLTDKNAIVSLDEGQVILTSPNDSKNLPVVLAPGQQAILSDNEISAPTSFDRTAVTAWLRGQFVFYNTPLADVVATLNRYRAGRIVITNSDLNARKVSGIFSTNEPDAALEMISRTLALNETRLTNYLVLLK